MTGDIEPIEPSAGASWPRLVQRRRGDEDGSGQRHGAEEQPPAEEELPEDEDGHKHIDIRV